jgi:pfkB family carbohydrate kinase
VGVAPTDGELCFFDLCRARSHDHQCIKSVGMGARRARPRFYTDSASFGPGLGDEDMGFEMHELDLIKLRAERRAGTAASGQRLRSDERRRCFHRAPPSCRRRAAVVPPSCRRSSLSVKSSPIYISGRAWLARPASSLVRRSRRAHRRRMWLGRRAGWLAVHPANVAAALARLGVMAAMVGPVADDALARELVETLLRGVNTACSQYMRGARTRRVKVHVQGHGERKLAGLVDNDADCADT